MDGRRDEAENCLSNLIVDVPLIDEHVRLIGDDLRVRRTHTCTGSVSIEKQNACRRYSPTQLAFHRRAAMRECR